MDNTRNKLSVVTTTYNCLEYINEYFLAFSNLDSTKFDWIIIDGGSNDGTAEFLAERSTHFYHLSVEPDSGVYFGINHALKKVRTPYYIVFGSDDIPSQTLIDDVAPLLDDEYSLIMGCVRMQPVNKIKTPGNRSLHWISWGRVISHHSVGTIINTSIHDRHGIYDTDFSICADGKLLKSVLVSSEPILSTRLLFGEFRLGGISSEHKIRAICELFIVQIEAGENKLTQLFLLNLRILFSLTQYVINKVTDLFGISVTRN